MKFKRNYWNISHLLLLLIVITLTSCKKSDPTIEKENHPNILLLVADDLGYADLGCYGGDIETPNIDNLAKEGIRFSRFHTSPLCATTRAMLLSGNDNHTAGMGIQSTKNNGFGYEGRLTNRIATIPELLEANGYHTYIAGKWHLGGDSLSIPTAKGFERSFINISGAGNHYDDQSLFEGNHKTKYLENGKPATWKKGNYSTDFFTDKLIEYIKGDYKDNKPFFAFAAYTSPHWPLQVDEKYWKKYEGRYNDGYESLKDSRLESLKNAGMIPKNAVLPPNHKRVIPWDSLTIKEKKIEARKMELYAGMVDNLDYNIGRIINYLKEIGEYENTIIVFMSDNGAAAEDFYYDSYYGPYIRKYFNDDYERMGQPDSFISYGPQWAEAGSSPFKFFKGLTTQGGINTPMIMTGPSIDLKNKISDEFITLMDLAPTFYEAAEVEYPKKLSDNKIYPLKGQSLWPFIHGKSEFVHDENYVFALEHWNRAMVRKGNWKIVSIDLPFSEENFKLYNLSNDLAELNDLKEVEPTKYNELLEAWRNYVKEVGVKIPSP